MKIKIVLSALLLVIVVGIRFTFHQLVQQKEPQPTQLQNSSVQTEVNPQKSYLQKLSPYLGNWTHSEVISKDRWELYDKTAEIGFIQNCTSGTCLNSVPQTYGLTQLVAKYTLDVGAVTVYEAKYDVGKLATVENGDDGTIVRQDVGFLFVFDKEPTHMLLVIEDTHSNYFKQFKSHLRNREFLTICNEAQTTQEMGDCAKKELDQAVADLKITLEENGNQLPSKSLLRTSQTSWQKYRNDYCSLLSNQYKGGSIQPVTEITCLRDITWTRIKELERLRLP